MLTKAMRKYVMSNKAGYNKNTQSTYDNRLEEDIVQALRDLTLLAERLPDKQLERVFNAKTLTTFFQALFKLKIEAEGNHKDWLQKKKDLKPKRDRLLKLSGAVLKIIGDGRFAVVLLPESLRFELDQVRSSVENLRPIFYTSMQEQEREEE